MQDRKLIKGSRFLTLAHGENLNQSGKQKLQALLEVNEELSIAYQLKEQFKSDLPVSKTGVGFESIGPMVRDGSGE